MVDAVERHEAVVIGAAPGGLAAAAMLREKDVETLVIDREDVAASWRGRYDRLHLHTWRLLSCVPGLRISPERGPWVGRDGVVAYLENYARHHGLNVRRGVEALRVDRDELPAGLEPLVGHLGVLDEGTGRPQVMGGRSTPTRPGSTSWASEVP